MTTAQAQFSPHHEAQSVNLNTELIERHYQPGSHPETLLCMADLRDKPNETAAAAPTDATKTAIQPKAFEAVAPSVLDKTGRPMIVDGKFEVAPLMTQYGQALDAIGKLPRSMSPDHPMSIDDIARETLAARAKITGERQGDDAVAAESNRLQKLNPYFADYTNLQRHNVDLYDDAAINKFSDDARFKFIPQAGQFAKLAHAKELHGKDDEAAFEKHIAESDDQVKAIYKKYALPKDANAKDQKPSLDPVALKNIADGTEKSDLLSPALAAQALGQRNQLYLLDVMTSRGFISKDEQTAALSNQNETGNKMIQVAINRELGATSTIKTEQDMKDMKANLGLKPDAKDQAVLDKIREANHALLIRQQEENRPAIRGVEPPPVRLIPK